MFVQIHMLQSLPPGNVNRDDTGQPKKCVFGGTTRGRISSQCLKRTIRRSELFSEYLKGESLRSKHLPGLLVKQLREEEDFDEAESAVLAKCLRKKFENKEDKKNESGPQQEQKEALGTGLLTPQLVFFTRTFVSELAGMIRNERTSESVRNKTAAKNYYKTFFDENAQKIAAASEQLTPDIALFGRMTTSDLVVDVEATCQVAHAIATHETVIEGDYFTAMDDRAEGPGAAYLGSGETVTFFDSAVYYKYMNVDTDALRDEKHLTEAFSVEDAAQLVGTFLRAAISSNPKGKQNSFASHGLPEYVLIELSKTKQPISYANAFLESVEGRNPMAASVTALHEYITSVAPAYAPADVRRVLLQVGSAAKADADPLASCESVSTQDEMVAAIQKALAEG